MTPPEWQHVEALRALCSERGIALDTQLPFAVPLHEVNEDDGFGQEALEALLDLLVDVDDPRMDAAALFFMQQQLSGTYCRITPLQRMKRGLNKQKLVPDRLLLNKQDFDDIHAWQNEP